MPQVKYGSTVLVHYTVSLKNGKIIESTAGADPLRLTVGGGKILRGIEEALEGMSAGESKRVTIPPQKAYGRRKPEAVSHHSLEAAAPFGPAPKEMQHQVVNRGGANEFSILITDREVEVDSNPLLAGEEIIVDIDVVDILT